VKGNFHHFPRATVQFTIYRRHNYKLLRDDLKDLNACTSNEDNNENTILQSEKVLVHFKTTYGHTLPNVLKRKQNMFMVRFHLLFHFLAQALFDLYVVNAHPRSLI